MKTLFYKYQNAKSYLSKKNWERVLKAYDKNTIEPTDINGGFKFKLNDRIEVFAVKNGENICVYKIKANEETYEQHLARTWAQFENSQKKENN